MLEVRVAELKSRLSAYLARVRRGESVVVLDRKTPIARLVPLAEGDLEIREPSASPSDLVNRVSPVKLRRPVSVEALLREDRDAR